MKKEKTYTKRQFISALLLGIIIAEGGLYLITQGINIPFVVGLTIRLLYRIVVTELSDVEICLK